MQHSSPATVWPVKKTVNVFCQTQYLHSSFLVARSNIPFCMDVASKLFGFFSPLKLYRTEQTLVLWNSVVKK